MPWSGAYETDVQGAMQSVDAALDQLRSQGATHVFVAGHSQGGTFALSYGVKHPVTGIIAIAPGGNVGSEVFKDKLGEYVEQARKLVAEGKGNEKVRLYDVDPGAGHGYGVLTTPAIYLSWFNPDGAMNEYGAVKKMNPATPVLFIAPTGDRPGLKRGNPRIFSLLPRNPHTKFYEPASSHTGAPDASAEEIARWTAEIAAAAHP
jgi:pimeloyl-ACP methyl ester carboxylesterase